MDPDPSLSLPLEAELENIDLRETHPDDDLGAEAEVIAHLVQNPLFVSALLERIAESAEEEQKLSTPTDSLPRPLPDAIPAPTNASRRSDVLLKIQKEFVDAGTRNSPDDIERAMVFETGRKGSDGRAERDSTAEAEAIEEYLRMRDVSRKTWQPKGLLRGEPVTEVLTWECVVATRVILALTISCRTTPRFDSIGLVAWLLYPPDSLKSGKGFYEYRNASMRVLSKRLDALGFQDRNQSSVSRIDLFAASRFVTEGLRVCRWIASTDTLTLVTPRN